MAITVTNPQSIQDNTQRVVDVQNNTTGDYEVLNATECSYSYLTSGTYFLKTGPGILHTVSILGAKSTSPISIYDSLTGSGTLIAQFSTGAQAVTFTFDAKFNTGLTVVVPSGDTITITYL